MRYALDMAYVASKKNETCESHIQRKIRIGATGKKEKKKGVKTRIRLPHPMGQLKKTDTLSAVHMKMPTHRKGCCIFNLSKKADSHQAPKATTAINAAIHAPPAIAKDTTKATYTMPEADLIRISRMVD